MLSGHVGDDEVLLVRQGGKLFALSAYCTHYHGPLADGLLVGETIRCPWHHAHFNLQTGEAIAAPALAPVTCWAVEEKDGKIFVKNKKTQPAPDKTAGRRTIYHRRWRRRRFCCRGDAAPARFRRKHIDAQQR